MQKINIVMINIIAYIVVMSIIMCGIFIYNDAFSMKGPQLGVYVGLAIIGAVYCTWLNIDMTRKQ